MKAFYDWKYYLMAHLLRCPSVIAKVSGKLEPKDLAHIFAPFAGFLWHRTNAFFKEHGRAPNFSFLETQAAEWVAENNSGDEEIVKISSVLAWVKDFPEAEFEPEEALKLCQKVLEQTRLFTPIKRLLMDGSGDAQKIFNTVQAGIRVSSVRMAEPIDPLENIEAILGTLEPTPLGSNDVLYFNRLCQGGIRPGEICVLIGPTGGFKTTMAIDVVSSMAQVHEFSAYFAYDQSDKDGDLRSRFVTRLAGIGRSRVESKSFIPDFMTEEERQRLAKAKECSSYIKWMDRANSTDRVANIAGLVKDLVERGQKPELVVIDQMLPWIQRWPECDTNLRQVALKTIDELKHQIAEAFQTRVLILHQLAADKTDRRPDWRPHMSHSAEVRGIGFWASFVLVLGTFCKTSSCLKAISSKTRRGKGNALTLFVDGEMGRFTDKSNEMIESKKVPGTFVRRGEEDRIPNQEDYGVAIKMKGDRTFL